MYFSCANYHFIFSRVFLAANGATIFSRIKSVRMTSRRSWKWWTKTTTARWTSASFAGACATSPNATTTRRRAGGGRRARAEGRRGNRKTARAKTHFNNKKIHVKSGTPARGRGGSRGSKAPPYTFAGPPTPTLEVSLCEVHVTVLLSVKMCANFLKIKSFSEVWLDPRGVFGKRRTAHRTFSGHLPQSFQWAHVTVSHCSGKVWFVVFTTVTGGLLCPGRGAARLHLF